jgi:hypothetical protein
MRLSVIQIKMWTADADHQTFFKQKLTKLMNVAQIFRCVRKIAKSDYELRRVCPSVRIEQLSCHWTDFHEI